MNKFSYLATLAVLILATAQPLWAAPLKLYVPEFKVTGAAGKDDLKGTLQSLLLSRLASDSVVFSESREGADVTVSGSYIAFGKIFSIDAQVANASGKVIGRAFEQGDATDDLIPAVGRLAQKLTGELAKVTIPVVPAASLPVPGTAIISPPAVAQPATPPSGDLVRPEQVVKSGEGGMVGPRLEGVMVGCAPGKRVGDERELYVALEREVRLYRQGKDLTLIASDTSFQGTEKIIGVDAADLDGDGTTEVYLTVMNGDELASRVLVVEEGKFRKIAENLPYFFRAIHSDGASKLYVQEMGRDTDFYGELKELVKAGSRFSTKNGLKLPNTATIFNTTFLAGKDGKMLFVVLHPDGFLTVFDQKGVNLWRSSDKYGGSETYFSREDQQRMRFTGDQYRKAFLEQRLTVTKQGDVIVPKNDGFFVIGNSRSFSKNSVYSFTWNGASLEERWHTKQSQNYLVDYVYDEERKELLVLEMVKRSGLIDKGASAFFLKKVE